jgi:putative transposase
MGNHFHILATGMEQEAQNASKKELFRRYRLMYGKSAEPPEGRYDSSGNLIPDPDGGVQRLRERLGSVSRFVQELKQTFSRWYNKKHKRTGYLWGGRFKGVIICKGEPQFVISSYIDLNPVRAGIVERPEDYRWSSLGMRVRSRVKAGKLLHTINFVDVLEESEAHVYSLPYVAVTDELKSVAWYREFVYVSGGIEREGKAGIPDSLVKQVVACNGYLGVFDRLRYRVKNFSEGVAIGVHTSIERFQSESNRKYIRARNFLDAYWSYATRVLRS